MTARRAGDGKDSRPDPVDEAAGAWRARPGRAAACVSRERRRGAEQEPLGRQEALPS